MGVFNTLVLQGEIQRTEICLATAFPSFPQELGCPLHSGEAGLGNIYRSLHREIFQVLAAAPKWDIPCHTPFAGIQACGGPALLSAGLTGGRVPPGWAPSRPLTDGKKTPNFYTFENFTQGAAPLLPFQRTIAFSNNKQCLLHRG